MSCETGGTGVANVAIGDGGDVRRLGEASASGAGGAGGVGVRPAPAGAVALEGGIQHDLVQSIVSALEARDPHTAEHSLRVGDMTERACLLMGLPDDQVRLIHMAAHVHDIGKIGIPDAVLLKRGPLTPAEHELLHSHVRIGAQILGGCPSLAAMADIVLHHHERWDGTGYLEGLAGEAIPLGSRVIAVTDSIDAMLGKRVARKSLTQEEAAQEIRAGIGSAYDPDVATLVLDRWDDVVGPVDFHDSGDFDKARIASALPRPLLRLQVPMTRRVASRPRGSCGSRP